MQNVTQKKLTVEKCTHVANIKAGFKWYVQTYHNPTGLPMDETSCQKFRTKKQALEHIKDSFECREGNFIVIDDQTYFIDSDAEIEDAKTVMRANDIADICIYRGCPDDGNNESVQLSTRLFI